MFYTYVSLKTFQIPFYPQATVPRIQNISWKFNYVHCTFLASHFRPNKCSCIKTVSCLLLLVPSPASITLELRKLSLIIFKLLNTSMQVTVVVGSEAFDFSSCYQNAQQC